jgi:chloride channel 3/4/5
VVALASAACLLSLTTKTVVPSTYHMGTLDENLAAVSTHPELQDDGATSPKSQVEKEPAGSMIYYSAAGSGVAEVRVILSGFVLHGFLGVKTLVVKTAALILSVASGLSLGKEGPFVHIATCIGNIACRMFDKYDRNDGKRREVLSAAAAAGVAVAFGAPLGGVLFSLEEVAYFFPAKTLFRTFFCCITAALSLKFLNPYGTNKVVIFEVRYLTDWDFFELVGFVVVGMVGGAIGALFIKASRSWAKSFRKISIVKQQPLVEVMLVALITGLISFWNPFTKLPVAKLLFNLSSPCDINKEDEMGLCPKNMDDIFPIIKSLAAAFFIKAFLTVITFGIVSNRPSVTRTFFHSAFSPEFCLAHVLTNTIESSCRYLRPFYGCRRTSWPNHRAYAAVDCSSISNESSLGQLRSSR